MNLPPSLNPTLWPARLIVACAAMFLVSTASAAPAKPANPAPKELPPAPKAVFIDDLEVGRDPCFPNSSRRRPKVTQTGGTKVPGYSVLDQLSLKGISAARTGRLALVNNVTLAVGEWTEIKSGPLAFKVRCLEIGDRSVVVGIEGSAETKTLTLREGI